MPRCTSLVSPLLLLCLAGCNGSGPSATTPADPVPLEPTLPIGIESHVDFRVVTLEIPDWYTTLTTQPEVNVAGEIAEWLWDFGDGASPRTSSQMRPEITLGAPGQYDGTLRLTDPNGISSNFPFSYTVLPGALPTIEGITPVGEAGGEFTRVQFSVATSGPPVTSIRWDFGAGAEPAIASGPEPEVRLQALGSYVGSVEVCGPFGCTVQSFGYATRTPQAVWTEFPAPTSSWVGTFVIGPNETPWLLYAAGPVLKLSELLDEAENSWRTRDLLSLAQGTIKALVTDTTATSLHIVLDAGRGKPITHAQFGFHTAAQSVLHLDNSNSMSEAYDDSYSAPALVANDQSAYLVVAHREGSQYRPAVRQVDLATNTISAPHFLTTGFRYGQTPVSLRAVDLMLLDDTLYLAQVTNAGAQQVEPGTLSVARRSALSSDAIWTNVTIDPGARACKSIAWVPTSAGLHLVYGVCHDTGRFPAGDPGFYYSAGTDYAQREAWCAVRDFETAAQWQTGRNDRLPHAGHRSQTHLNGRTVLADGYGTSLRLAYGSAGTGGAVPWTTQTYGPMGTLVLGESALAATRDAIWVAVVDYQQYYPCYSGHTYCTGSYGDPRLVIGKLALD